MPSLSAPSSSTEPAAAGWRLEHTYAALPDRLHTPTEPTAVHAPRLVVCNDALASELGLDPAALRDGDGAAIFAGNVLPPGAAPLAQAYAGHQFGHFVVLGDGRAILLGEQRTPAGELRDIQLKGSGPTVYSRRGDGRAALGPMLREYLISEAMHALGIPTTRSLAVAATGEEVWREAGGLPGAVLTRVAASHLRVGTFEFAAAHRDTAALQALVDYTMRRHYPELAESGPANPALVLLRAVVERQADLIARWMSVGFVHGVMNTDNMALSGETIDYGPCAFIDAYDPATVFSSIDRHGRYAFGNQPSIALWNLARLGEALLPLINADEPRAIASASEILQGFAPTYDRLWLARFRAKLGLDDAEDDDAALVRDLLDWMQQNRADFTQTFANLDPVAEPSDPDLVRWQTRWRERLARQSLSAEEAAARRRSSNPAVIPRNHLVEAALTAAGEGDLDPFNALLEMVTRPFDRDGIPAAYRQAAPAEAPRYVTYCGT